MQIERLQFNEIERIAYITGHPLLTMLAEYADDGELLEDSLDDKLEEAAKDGYNKGYKAGLGEDADKMISALRHELALAQASKNKAHEIIGVIYTWLDSDGCKTVKGRREFSVKVRNAWMKL